MAKFGYPYNDCKDSTDYLVVDIDWLHKSRCYDSVKIFFSADVDGPMLYICTTLLHFVLLTRVRASCIILIIIVPMLVCAL